MKYFKQIVLIAIIAILTGCGASKTVKQTRKTLKGIWTLNTVTYSQEGTFKVNLFNDASAECLEGSEWRFIPNNNFGNYSLSGSDCEGGTRYFVWTVQEIGGDFTHYDILVKPTDAKMKSITNLGFRVNIAYLGEEQLQMTQTVDLEGEPFQILMNFIKTGQ